METQIPLFNKQAPQWLRTTTGTVLFHLAFWFIFFLLLVWEVYVDSPLNIALIDSAMYLIIIATAVYINTEWLIPKFFYQKRYVVYAILLLLVIAIDSAFKANYWRLIPDCCSEDPLKEYPLSFKIYYHVFHTFIEVVAISSIKILIDWGKSRARVAELETQQLESELKFLKAQINPHFLFNTLNNIYFLIKKNPEVASDALMKLSEMLRLQLYETNEKKIDIDKEIEYIKNYITLEKLRNNDAFLVDFIINGNFSGLQIEPFLFLTLTENAFKHSEGYYDKKKRRIKISFDFTEKEIVFKTENSKATSENKSIDEKSGGIGLPNLKKRLQLLYPESHNLIIQDNIDNFIVELRIKKK